jgi:hypothetical protein
MTMGESQPWLRPSPELWRMRRAEVLTVTVVFGAIFGLAFLRARGPLAGLISVLVWVALGGLFALFFRRRFRAWRYQEWPAASWCNGSPSCPMGACNSSR